MSNLIGFTPLVLSCALLLVFSRLKCLILVTQSPKYTRLKRITDQLSFVYIVAKSLYIICGTYSHNSLSGVTLCVFIVWLSPRSYANVYAMLDLIHAIMFSFSRSMQDINTNVYSKSSAQGPMNLTINLFLNQNQKGQVFYLVSTVAKFVDFRTEKKYLLMLEQKMSSNKKNVFQCRCINLQENSIATSLFFQILFRPTCTSSV